MPLPVVPLTSENEKQHRTIIATVLNELVKQYPLHASWTPVVRGSGTAGTYEIATNFSRVTRIGRRVWLDFGIVFAAVITGGGTVDLRVTGVPYAKAANTYPIGTLQTGGIDWDAGADLGLAFDNSTASSQLIVRQTFDNASASSLPISAVAAGETFFGSICYETDDP